MRGFTFVTSMGIHLKRLIVTPPAVSGDLPLETLAMYESDSASSRKTPIISCPVALHQNSGFGLPYAKIGLRPLN